MGALGSFLLLLRQRRGWRAAVVASMVTALCCVRCRRLDDGTTMATRVTMKMLLYFVWQRRYWRAAILLFDAAEAKVACGVFVASKVTALW